MIIKKGSKAAELIIKVAETEMKTEVPTLKVGTRMFIFKNKIVLNSFKNFTFEIPLLKEEEPDFDIEVDDVDAEDENALYIENNNVVKLFSNILKEKDLEIKHVDDFIEFEGFKVKVEKYTLNNPKDNWTTTLSFNKEQFSKLEKYFTLTLSNWIEKPNLVDVLLFGFKEGNLYRVAPNRIAYNIGNFDAVINQVNIDQNFGHCVALFYFPKYVYDIIKGSNKIEFKFASPETKYYITADGIDISVYMNTAVSEAFLKHLLTINEAEGNLDFTPCFNSIREKLKYIDSIQALNTSDDFVSFENGTKELHIEELVTTIEPSPLDIVFNLYALKFIVENGESFTVSTTDTRAIVKANEDNYILSYVH